MPASEHWSRATPTVPTTVPNLVLHPHTQPFSFCNRLLRHTSTMSLSHDRPCHPCTTGSDAAGQPNQWHSGQRQIAAGGRVASGGAFPGQRHGVVPSADQPLQRRLLPSGGLALSAEHIIDPRHCALAQHTTVLILHGFPALMLLLAAEVAAYRSPGCDPTPTRASTLPGP